MQLTGPAGADAHRSIVSWRASRRMAFFRAAPVVSAPRLSRSFHLEPAIVGLEADQAPGQLQQRRAQARIAALDMFCLALQDYGLASQCNGEFFLRLYSRK